MFIFFQFPSFISFLSDIYPTENINLIQNYLHKKTSRKNPSNLLFDFCRKSNHKKMLDALPFFRDMFLGNMFLKCIYSPCRSWMYRSVSLLHVHELKGKNLSGSAVSFSSNMESIEQERNSTSQDHGASDKTTK